MRIRCCLMTACLVAMLAACKGGDKPNISSGKMEELLYDYTLADGICQEQHPGDSAFLKAYREAIFKKHDVTEAEFDSSLKWYMRHPDEMYDIYDAISKKIEEIAAQEGAEAMVIAAKTEEDIASLDTYEDKKMFLDELGMDEPGVNRLIKKAYHLLNLQTFITAGEMEVKAWTFHKGWKAPQCAGVIHTDFEKGFIRAEVIKYEDYLQYKSEAAVREAGKLNIEGKDYVVQDGDIMHFRFNV